jgi:hypothetical protein
MSSQTVAPNTESAILARLVQCHSEPVTPEVANYLLAFAFEPQDVRRMDELAERNRGGMLTAEERVEIESYLHVSNLLSIMQSKARRSLKSMPPDSGQ